MAGTGIGNPVGAVQVADFGCPKLFTAIAKEVISGGVYVFASGADNVVSSGTNSYVASDVEVAGNASGASFTGIAMQTAASGAAVAVALEGVFILQANGTVTAAGEVLCDGSNAVATGVVAGTVIGRALTSAASGGYCLVHIK